MNVNVEIVGTPDPKLVEMAIRNIHIERERLKEDKEHAA